MESLAPFSFGKMLRAFRKRRRLTQQALADKLEVHRNTVILWEGDKPFPGTKAMVFRLAEHLRLSEQEKRQLLDASVTGASPKSNVPYPRNPFFTGREEILETLHQCLAGDQVVALTQSYALSGLGGIGKTHLAVEYTYRHDLEYSAILWIGAESVETILSSFVTIAELLQLPERQEPDQQQIVAAVRRWLSTHRQWLLVFDNVEDLRLLQGFLPATSQGAVLITTRSQALGTLAQGIELSPMRPEEGLLLLLRRAKVLGPQAKLEQIEELEEQRHGEYQTAQELVAAMDGLPLALDQAGAYIEETSCSLEDYLKLFQTRQVQLLRRRGEVTSDHPASVVATWSLSFEKVEQANPLASDLLRLCAFLHSDAIPEEVLLQGITFLDKQPETEAADRLQLHEAMRTVSAYSLLRYQRGEKTCSMHRLVQVVFRDDGMDKAQIQQWMENAVHVVDAVLPPVEPATWERYERLVPHALVCVNHTLCSEQAHLEMASLLFKTATYLLERFQHGGAESLFLRALQIREQRLTSSHPDVARSLNGLAQLYRYQGELEKAEALYQRTLHIFWQVLTSSHPDLATPLNNLATLYTQQGKYAEADTHSQQALRILEQAWGPEHPDGARSLNNLAILHHVQGQLESAEPLYQRALRIWEQVPFSELHAAVPLTNLASLYRDQGKFAEAELLYQRTLSIWEQAHGPSHPSVAYALANLITLYAQQGKFAEAGSLSRRALSVWEQAREHPLVANSLNALDVSKMSHFGSLFLTIEKHSQLVLLHPHAVNGLANFSTQ